MLLFALATPVTKIKFHPKIFVGKQRELFELLTNAAPFGTPSLLMLEFGPYIYQENCNRRRIYDGKLYSVDIKISADFIRVLAPDDTPPRSIACQFLQDYVGFTTVPQ